MKNPSIDDTNIETIENDDFFIDESLIRLMNILIPRMKWIILISVIASLFVGMRLFFFTPRQYVCSAVIAPDVMRDLNSFDLVQLTSVDSDTIQLPYASQLSQLKTLAESSQVKLGIIQENDLMRTFQCNNTRDCLNKLKSIYSVNEIRNVGLKLTAKYINEEIPLSILDSAIDQTNKFFKDAMIAKAVQSVSDIHKWINDVNKSIEDVASEYIDYASNNNITDLESQFSSGIALIGTIKQQIVMKEAQLAELMQQYGDDSTELLPIKGTIDEFRLTLKKLLTGKEEDNVFPALSNYESLRIKVRDYQDKLQMLRNRADLFNKQLAAAQIESQKQSRSLMILDEPFIEPAPRGTVKFSILTFIGVFFFACILFIMNEYWKTLKDLMKNSTQEKTV